MPGGAPGHPVRLRLSLPALELLQGLLGDLPLPLRSPDRERRRLAQRMGGAALPADPTTRPGSGPDPATELHRVGALTGAGPDAPGGPDPRVAAPVAAALTTLSVGSVRLAADVDTAGTASVQAWFARSGTTAAALVATGGHVELSAFAADRLADEVGRLLPGEVLPAGATGPPDRAGQQLSWDAVHGDLDDLRGRLSLVVSRRPDDDADDPEEAPSRSASVWQLLGTTWHAADPVGVGGGDGVVLRAVGPADLGPQVDRMVALAARATR